MKTEFMEIAQRNYLLTQKEKAQYIPRHATSNDEMSKKEMLFYAGVVIVSLGINYCCNIAMASMR